MKIIDSHTAGEPTRVIIEGGPDLGPATMAERLQRFKSEFDHYRQAAILEPRGSDAVVGALLCEPIDKQCAAGVIFFNNTGYLGMCGHGAIGLAVTLHYMGKIDLGEHLIETPVGIIRIHLLDSHTVEIENVASYCYQQNVELDVAGVGKVCGDIAWGGNWFFLVNHAPAPLVLDNVDTLTRAATRIKSTLAEKGITGANGGEIDHIEFFSEPHQPHANSRNFVLCPGNAYDRSPCGTGTSAKLACLAAKQQLQPSEQWIQESVIGSEFIASYRLGDNNTIIPTIKSQAYICSEATLIQQPNDPFIYGIR